MDVSPVLKLRPAPLRNTAFILDVHLGKLAKLLRMLGFDAAFDWRLDDRGTIRRALAEQRTARPFAEPPARWQPCDRHSVTSPEILQGKAPDMACS